MSRLQTVNIYIYILTPAKAGHSKGIRTSTEHNHREGETEAVLLSSLGHDVMEAGQMCWDGLWMTQTASLWWSHMNITQHFRQRFCSALGNCSSLYVWYVLLFAGLCWFCIFPGSDVALWQLQVCEIKIFDTFSLIGLFERQDIHYQSEFGHTFSFNSFSSFLLVSTI